MAIAIAVTAVITRVRAHSRLNFSKKKSYGVVREREKERFCVRVLVFHDWNEKRICYHPSSVKLSFSLAALAIPSTMSHHHWHIFPMSQSLSIFFESFWFAIELISIHIQLGFILQPCSSLPVSTNQSNRFYDFHYGSENLIEPIPNTHTHTHEHTYTHLDTFSRHIQISNLT